MTIISLVGMGWLTFEYRKEQDKIVSFPSTIGPDNYFVDIYNYSEGLSFISVIFAGAIILLALGVYRIMTNARPPKKLTAIAFAVVFPLLIIQAIQAGNQQKDTISELLSVQHTWAEQRYGIEYDEITVRTWEGRKGQTNRVQDNVMKDGQNIATVCPYDRYNILFCEPGTTDELPVYTNDAY